MAIEFDHMPTCDPKTLGHVFTDGQFGAAIVSDLVVVPQQDEFSQLQVTCERDHFLPHTFLHAALAHKCVCVVVDQTTAKARIQVSLGHGHAKSIGNALPQRAGGDFNAVG